MVRPEEKHVQMPRPRWAVTDHSLPTQPPSFLHQGTLTISYLRCLQPREHALAGALRFLSVSTIDIADQIILFRHGPSCALQDL